MNTPTYDAETIRFTARILAKIQPAAEAADDAEKALLEGNLKVCYAECHKAINAFQAMKRFLGEIDESLKLPRGGGRRIQDDDEPNIPI